MRQTTLSVQLCSGVQSSSKASLGLRDTMSAVEAAPLGAAAEDDLMPPGMEEEAPAKTEEAKPEPAAAPAPAPAVSAPVTATDPAPVTTPVSAPQAVPTSQPIAEVSQPAASAPPAATASTAPVAAPAVAPAPVAQYPPYGYGAYPGYAPSMPIAGAGYGYDPVAAYWGYYGHAAPTGTYFDTHEISALVKGLYRGCVALSVGGWCGAGRLI